MKKFFIVTLVALLAMSCTNKGEQLLKALEEQPEMGMFIYNQGEITSYNQPFVLDLLHLTAEEPERLRGAIVADRRVGKAAASLLIVGGVKTVYTPLVSTLAREMLEKAGIGVHAREEIPVMVNADGSNLCPMERKLLEIESAEECALVLRGGSPIGKQMLDMLNEQHLSLLVYNDSTLTTHANRGVRDLLQLISEQPERLNGAIVADKIIGKAAAALMITGGVKEVHTNIICTDAKQLFQAHEIPVFATEEVLQILNRDRTAKCPIDSQLEGVESVEECVNILQNLKFGA